MPRMHSFSFTELALQAELQIPRAAKLAESPPDLELLGVVFLK